LCKTKGLFKTVIQLMCLINLLFTAWFQVESQLDDNFTVELAFSGKFPFVIGVGNNWIWLYLTYLKFTDI